LAAAVLAAELATVGVALTVSTTGAQAQWFGGGGDDRIPRQRSRRVQPQQESQGFPFFRSWAPSYRTYRETFEPDPRVPREPSRIGAAAGSGGDFSKAPPPPRKPETEPATTVMVMGDSLADWLAYGLEDAFADHPEIGVVRKNRTGSSLIRTEGRDGYDWVTAARDMLAAEKADFVVMLIGLGDRQPIRERQPPRNPAAKPGQKPEEQKAAQQNPAQQTPEGAAAEQPSIMAPEPERLGATVPHEFRSEKWAELYGKRVDDLIGVLNAKRVPVLWVGLPPVRGPRSRTDLSYLNELYRARAEKAGAIYIDVWDGFLDESGDFSTHGPDVIGQMRRLRTSDGVHFTKAGARKLAHYVEREIQRLLTRATPALPVPDEPQAPAAAPQPTGPAPRPVAGPVVPLTGYVSPSEGGLLEEGRHSASADPAAVRVLGRGEAIAAPVGRADNFAWPPPTTMAADETPEPVGAAAAARPSRQVVRPTLSRPAPKTAGPVDQKTPAPAAQKPAVQAAPRAPAAVGQTVPRPPAPIGQRSTTQSASTPAQPVR
jgi:hypothetical protein